MLNHRIHHKFYGTEDDPFNHKKGFLYCHILSNLIATDHAKREQLARAIDMRDIDSDPYVCLQRW